MLPGCNINQMNDIFQDVRTARSLHQRYQKTRCLEDLEQTIRLYYEAMGDLLQFGQPLAAVPVADPISEDNSREKLLAAIKSAEISTHTGSQSANQPSVEDLLGLCRIDLTAALRTRYEHLGDTRDLDQQARLCREGLRGLPSSHARFSAHLCGLGVSLRDRYLFSGEVADIEEAIDVQRQARRCHVDGFVSLNTVLDELACTLIRRFRDLGNHSDASEALDLHSQALNDCGVPILDSDRALRLLHFGATLSTYYLGKIQDVPAITSPYLQMLDLHTSGKRDRAQAFGGMAVVFWRAYEQTGAIVDLDKAISYASEAVQLTTQGDPIRFMHVGNLAITLQRRYVRLGRVEDLDRSVDLGRDLLKQLDEKHRFRCNALSNLSVALRDVFLLRGDIATLEESIKLQREGVELCTIGNPQRGIPINSLAQLMLIRYNLGRDMEDLLEALRLWREALDLRPTGHPDHGEALCQLAEGLITLFKHTGEESSLNEAISLHELWSEIGNSSDHRQGFFVQSAANAFCVRFEHSKDIADIGKAIVRYRTSLALRPVGHPERHVSLHILASALRVSYQISGNPEDIAAAKALHAEAVDLLPSGHPDRAQILCGLARLYLVEGSVYFSATSAMDAISDALADSHCNAQVRLAEASDVLQTLDERITQYPTQSNLSHRRLLDVHQLAIRLLPSVANFGLDIHSRLRLLAKAENIVARAARLALALQEPTTVVEILEEGRAVFWAQFVRLRTTFDALPPDISKQMVMMANQLDAGSQMRTSLSSSAAKDKIMLEEQAAQRRAISEKFEALVLKIRTIDGLDRFMLPAIYSALAEAVPNGIIVTLIPGQAESHALIMRRDTKAMAPYILSLAITEDRLVILSNRLKNANFHQRQRLWRARGIHVSHSCVDSKGAQEVLRELWDTVVNPVISKLQIKPSAGRERPRLWWCATGVSAFLPVHAAGSLRARENAATCSDYVISSYTPTIGALISARPKNASIKRTAVKVLLAGVPHPFAGETLEDVIMETHAIKSIVPSLNVIPLPPDADCSINPTASAAVHDVILRLPDASFLHLACHGIQDRTNALDSGFVMRDSMMTVAQLMSLKLPHAFLAFLSACETAKGDERQPDQAVHLAATMLFVGFRSVIGTMWSMGDVDGTLVAQTVYKQVFGDDSEYLDPDVIPYALDEAMQKLRARGLHPSRWAPYIHLGV